MQVSTVCSNVRVHACTCTRCCTNASGEPEPVHVTVDFQGKRRKRKKKMFPEIQSVLVEENAVCMISGQKENNAI